MTRPTDAEGRRCERCIGYLRPRRDCPDCGGTGTQPPPEDDGGQDG